MTLAQNSIFANRDNNPLHRVAYAVAPRTVLEDAQVSLCTQSDWRAAVARANRGTAPQTLFAESMFNSLGLDRMGYKRMSDFMRPWNASSATATVEPPSQPINESSHRGGTRPTKDTELGDGLDDSNQELYKKLVRANQGVLKTPAHNNKQVGVSIRPSLMQGYRKDLSGIMSTVSNNAQPIRKARMYTRSWARQAEGFDEASVPIEEVSAKAKLAYLRRKLKRRYFKRKPTAVAFQDVVMPADDSLTEGYVPDAHAEIYDVNDHVATLVAVRDTVTNSDGSGVDIPRGTFFTRDKNDLYLTANAHSNRKIKPKVGMQLHDDDGALYNCQNLKKAPHNPVTLQRMRDIASGKRRLGDAG